MINLKLSDYNLREAQISLIKKLIDENPQMTIKEYANALGCSERNFYRMIKIYKLGFCNRGRLQKIDSMISKLSELGYVVIKKED